MSTPLYFNIVFITVIVIFVIFIIPRLSLFFNVNFRHNFKIMEKLLNAQHRYTILFHDFVIDGEYNGRKTKFYVQCDNTGDTISLNLTSSITMIPEITNALPDKDVFGGKCRVTDNTYYVLASNRVFYGRIKLMAGNMSDTVLIRPMNETEIIAIFEEMRRAVAMVESGGIKA